MAKQHPTQATPATQPARSGIGFLADALDNINATRLLETLKCYHPTGRAGYNPRAMWRAVLTKFILKIRFNNHLLERLRGSKKLREVCGFRDYIPSESVLSRFTTRLADHVDLIEQCLIRATNQLKDLVPTIKHHKNGQDQPLPPLGTVTAIDSTLFETYANPNRKVVKDPDARWGVKHSSRTKEGKTEFGFGYKMHLASDTTHGVPLTFTVTPANANDSTQLQTVTNKMLQDYPWMEPGALLADRGYDSLTNHQFLSGLDIIPVIHIRKPTADDNLYDSIYTKEGKPTCMSGKTMDYIRTDQKTGAHLFRCAAQGCRLKTQGTKAITHCDTEVWEDPGNNLRVLGLLPRFTAAWKRLYRENCETPNRLVRSSFGG